MNFLILNEEFLDLLYVVCVQTMPEEVGIGNFHKINNVFLLNKYQNSYFDILSNFMESRQRSSWSKNIDAYAKRMLNFYFFLAMSKENSIYFKEWHNFQNICVEALNTDLWISTMYVGSMVSFFIEGCI